MEEFLTIKTGNKSGITYEVKISDDCDRGTLNMEKIVGNNKYLSSIRGRIIFDCMKDDNYIFKQIEDFKKKHKI